MKHSFDEMLRLCPEVTDFRKLADGTWFAYSTVADENGASLRSSAKTISAALTTLKGMIDEKRRTTGVKNVA